MNTHRQLGINSGNGAKSIEKLSSGFRINRAGDDAAGLSISEKMRSQIRGLNQASRNAQDGISMIQTAEGALQETEAILQRMRELSVQGSNDTLEAEDRTAIGQELKDLTSEIDRISNTTEFNGKKLLDGSLSTTQSTSGIQVGDAAGSSTTAVVSAIDVSGADAGASYTFTASGADLILTRDSDSVSQRLTVAALSGTQSLDFSELGVSIELTGTGPAASLTAELASAADLVTAAGNSSAKFIIGANGTAAETMTVAFDEFSASNLGTTGDELASLVSGKTATNVISSSGDATTLISSIDEAINQISTQRSKLGAAQNRLEHSIKNLDTSSENLQAAESRIRDVDMAAEMMTFTKNNILQQAAQAMLAQANQAPQGVLQLLR